MATSDTAAKNERATNWATDYASATVTLYGGPTILAVHTLVGFGAAAGGVVTALSIPDETFLATGTIDSCLLENGTGTYTLTVGLSGADVNLSSLDAVIGEPSTINSMSVTFP